MCNYIKVSCRAVLENRLSLVDQFSWCLQLASVILKQYVETHWCSQSEKFRPPETTDQVSQVETGHAPKSLF